MIARSESGVRYLAVRYTQRLTKAGAVTSFGTTGDSYAIFAKIEIFHPDLEAAPRLANRTSTGTNSGLEQHRHRSQLIPALEPKQGDASDCRLRVQ